MPGLVGELELILKLAALLKPPSLLRVTPRPRYEMRSEAT